MAGWWVALRNKLESDISDFGKWWAGTSLGQAIDQDARDAISELEKLTAQDAEKAGITIGEAALKGLATGGVAGAFAAGVAAAPDALKAAENDISQTTITTVVSSVVNQLQAMQVAKSGVATS